MDLEVIYNEIDLHNLPKGCNNNKPLLRKKKIISTITRYNTKVNELIKMTSLNSKASLLKASSVHCPQFLKFLTNAYNDWLAFADNRDLNYYYEQEIIHVDNNNNVVNCEDEIGFIPAQTAPRFDTLQRAGKNVHAQICYYGVDRFTPIFSDTRDSLEADLHTIDEAFNHLKDGDFKRIYALTTQPGHHSGRDFYGGYCYVNLGAYCTSLMETHWGNVAHIDIDYHAGNGTMSIFWDNPSVLFASLHCDPHFEYPFNTGFEDQTGGEKAKGKTINIPLAPKTDIHTYLSALKRVKKEIIHHGAKALVVSLGVDTLEGDLDATPNCGFAIKLEDFSKIGEEIIGFDLPTIYVQEGGYLMDAVGEAVLRVLLGNSFDSLPSRVLSH